MASRTNKMGILKKKLQQAKQKNLKKTIDQTENKQDFVKKQFTNPKGNIYTRFLRSGKYICDSTSSREDGDGYRIVRKANGGEINFKLNLDGRGFRKYQKKIRKIKKKI